MRHLELFAGIGGFRRAMDILTNDHIMEFHCIGYSEIDSKAEATYRSNYAIGKDEIVMGDIVAFTNDKKNIKSLPKFDLLTGGFPCQTFSMMGNQTGFDEDRGQMFFRIMDILMVKKPKYVLLENVKNLWNHDKGRTFARIKSELESIGYSTKIEFSEGFFNELYSSVQEFFGDKPIQTYNVNIYRRSDSRIYLNSLRNGSFSIRNFLIEEISVLIFSKDSHGNNIIRLDIIDNLSENVKEDISQDLENPTARQIIYYGAPGTGKSHKINEILGEYEGCPEDKKVPKANIFRTTFHPDSDYSSFVGAYKPTMKKQKDKIYTKGELISKLTEMKDGGVTYSPQKFGAKYWRSLKQLNLADKKDILQACGMSDNYTVELDKGIAVGEEYLTNSEESRIIYSFIPQTFLNAYIRAYQTDENVYLIIEEINRGNCAQIFGDLFQLLDRDGKGKSEYTIKADADLKTFLENELGEGCEAIKDGELCLPPNLYIYATMNTSDQSLFPIDSAFKRRWDWEYEPIKYKNTDWLIDIDGLKYRWSDFQKEVNTRILNDTGSEDKMLGDYFVNPSAKVISYDLFRNKILFYLWNDVCKDGDADIFPTNEEFSFSRLYDEDSKRLIVSMMDKLELKPIDNSTEDK